MMKPSKAQAMAHLQRSLDEVSNIRDLNHQSSEFTKWHRDTRVGIGYVFGQDSSNAQDFGSIQYSPNLIPSTEQREREVYLNGLNRASAILSSMIDEVETWWPHSVQITTQTDVPNGVGVSVSNRVFVVHGRDEEAKQTVARYLERLELEPVILQEQPNEGRTIIEKFEEYAEVGFAVVLCTPDDVGALESERYKLNPRPRQNVVLEWGFFLGKIGRNRVCALLKGGVEIPSDYDGVIYIPLDDFGGWRMELAREMRKAGLPVDMNRL